MKTKISLIEIEDSVNTRITRKHFTLSTENEDLIIEII